MIISERMLKKWRREALVYRSMPPHEKPINILSRENGELRERILRMTQELLDQHLIRRKS